MQMTRIFSNLAATKKIADRLVRRNADLRTAESKRDACLYKFLQSIHDLSEVMRKMKPVDLRKELKTQYSNVPNSRDPAVLAMKLTHLNLHRQMSSKYAIVLRSFRADKKLGQSVKSFVKEHGDINKCVTAERRSRSKRQTLRGKPK
jgi:hypothetical protein